MKKLFKKVVSVGLTAALTLSMAITGTSSASALTTNVRLLPIQLN